MNELIRKVGFGAISGFVSAIVVDLDASTLTVQFETTTGAAKIGECGSSLGERVPHGNEHGDCARCVDRIVAPRDGQG